MYLSRVVAGSGRAGGEAPALERAGVNRRGPRDDHRGEPAGRASRYAGRWGRIRPVTFTIAIDPHSADAPYEQVRAQISEQARSGELPVGYRLPTVRALAGELGLAANTVAKAYRALEGDGVVETRGRHGTVVAAAGDAAARQAASAAAEFATRAHRLGLTREQAGAAAAEALRTVYEGDGAAG